MNTFLIIYLIGYILSFIIGIIRLWKELTAFDVIVMFIMSLFSWMSVIILIFGSILLKHKKYYDDLYR